MVPATDCELDFALVTVPDDFADVEEVEDVPVDVLVLWVLLLAVVPVLDALECVTPETSPAVMAPAAVAVTMPAIPADRRSLFFSMPTSMGAATSGRRHRSLKVGSTKPGKRLSGRSAVTIGAWSPA